MQRVVIEKTKTVVVEKNIRTSDMVSAFIVFVDFNVKFRFVSGKSRPVETSGDSEARKRGFAIKGSSLSIGVPTSGKSTICS